MIFEITPYSTILHTFHHFCIYLYKKYFSYIIKYAENM